MEVVVGHRSDLTFTRMYSTSNSCYMHMINIHVTRCALKEVKYGH